MKNKGILTIVIILASISCSSLSIETQNTASPIITPTIIPPIPALTNDQAMLENEENVLLDFAISPDGTQLAIYTNKSIRLHNLKTSQENVIENFATNSYIRYTPGSVTFTQDGSKLLISGKFDNQPIRIWNIENSNWEGEVENTKDFQLITSMEFSPGGNALLIQSISRFSARCEGPGNKLTLITFDKNPGKILFETDGCMIAPSEYRFTNNGKLFIFNGTMSSQYSVYTIDANTGEVISLEIYDSEEDGVFYDISSNGKIAAISGYQKELTKLVDITNMDLVGTIQGQLFLRLINNEKDFFAYDFKTELWEYWIDGEKSCVYNGLDYMGLRDNSRINFNLQLIAAFTYNKELKIFNIQDCNLLKEFSFSD